MKASFYEERVLESLSLDKADHQFYLIKFIQGQGEVPLIIITIINLHQNSNRIQLLYFIQKGVLIHAI